MTIEHLSVGQCVYCLRELPRKQLTDDHIIAGSWYPETTPGKIQRPTAPACNDCNNRRYAPIERYVMLRLAACVDSQHPAAAGIWEKAKHSIEPGRASRERDRMHRAMQRAALGREVRELTEIPGGTLPFSIPNLHKGSRHAILISAAKLNGLVEKWARGFYYFIHGGPLRVSGRVEVMHVAEEHADVAFREIWLHARIIDGGPGVQVRVWSAEGDGRREEIYAFSIWDQFRVYAAITDPLCPGKQTGRAF